MILEPGELEETLLDRSRYCIKDHCASCDVKIPKSWDHFQVYGNYCTTCSGRIKKMCEGALSRRLSREEGYEMLRKRIEGVKSGKILH